MAYPKSRRRPPLPQALAWFVPGWIAVAIAAAWSHPLTLIALLLAHTLTMAAVCHAIGFDPEPRFLRTALRRGAAHLVVFTAFTAIVLLLVAWPMLLLSRAPNLGHALLLGAALLVALASLWRVWPAFGLLFVWDDAYPNQGQGSWIFTAAARCLSFGRHLSREMPFFTHFLPAGLALLVLAFLAVALTGLYGVLSTELRASALAVYGAVLLPLGCLVVANRSLRGMLREGRGRAARGEARPPRQAPDIDAVAPLAAAPAAVAPPAPLSEEERTAGTPEQAAALLAATRDGDIERALALIEAGADPNTAPAADDRDRRPVLMLAALLPDTQLLRALIAKGADVNQRSGGLTPLLAATRDSWHGRAEAVLTLLSNGADAQAADGEGNTPLHGAVLSAEATVAAMLLDGGAAINALNHAGASALGVACRAANWPLARFLLERHAKPTPAGGEPALVAAAGIADDDAEGVKLLLKHRAAVNAVDQRHRSALMTAAAEGHEQIARALRAAGAQVDLADRHGHTALMEAAHAGAHGIVQLLAEAQPNVRLRDSHGRDALTLACQSPHARAETVRALLALGAEPNTHGADGRSALDHAAAAGRWDLVTLLDPQTPLPANLHLDSLPEGADTPAHLLDALRFGHWGVVSTFAGRVRDWPQARLAQLYLDLAAPGLAPARRWLLEHGLDAEARLQPQLIEAAVEPHDGAHAPLPSLGRRLFDALLLQLPTATEAVEDLLQAGATPAGAGLLAQALLRLDDSAAAGALSLTLLERGADPFGVEAAGRTPLHLAASRGQLPLLRTLLARGGDPNSRDLRGRTPLFAALGHGDQALPLVRVLVAHGADAEIADVNGETPLGLALDHGPIERWLDWGGWTRPHRPLRADDLPAAAAAGAEAAVARLLELDFPVDTRDQQGASALLRACGAGHRAIAALLLDAGADATLAANSGVTPLAAAAAARRDDTVSLLLERGIDPDQRLPGESTALMVASALGYPEIVELLLTAGAEVNAVDGRGRGGLHAAAQFCFENNDSLRGHRLLDVLLKRGAEINRADQQGMTPLLLLLGAHQRPGGAADATHLGALVPVLLESGARIEHADQRGVTALHACAMHALLAPARLLLARGADRAAVDGFGRNAAEVARHIGYIDIAHELAARVNAVPSVRQTLRRPAQPEG